MKYQCKILLNKFWYALLTHGVITVIFFLFNVLPEILQEWCWIKIKTHKFKTAYRRRPYLSIYIISMTSLTPNSTKNESDYNLFEWRKNTMQHNY
jgi:hypothetical protein